MPAATIDMRKFLGSLNETMNAKFSPGEKVEYLLAQQELPYLSLNRPSFEVAGINEQEAEQAIQLAVPAAIAALAPPPGQVAPAAPAPVTAPEATPPPLAKTVPPARSSAASKQRSRTRSVTAVAPPSPPAPPPVRLAATPEVVHTYTREELASGVLPPSEWGLLLAHSYSPNGGWYVMVIPAAYQMQTLSSGGTTHFSPWSYDRHVPLGFFGAPFTPGIYHGRVQPVDLAATLASLLGLTQPSASVGTILTQAIHTVPAVPGPRVTRPVHTEGPPSP
jgi:hypothetical protein